jgi:hypothetical protein
MAKLLILVLLMCSVAAGQDPSATGTASWEKFSSSEGRFTLLSPTKPEAASREVDSKVGKLMLYTFSSNSQVAFLMISYGDYPNAASDSVQAERILDGVRDGVIRGSSTSLIAEKQRWIRGYPGREFTGSGKSEGRDISYSWRIYLVGRRLYQVAGATLATNAGHPDVAKFLDSFDLIQQ